MSAWSMAVRCGRCRQRRNQATSGRWPDEIDSTHRGGGNVLARLGWAVGLAAGLVGWNKNDRLSADGRVVELWEAFQAPIVPGDRIRFEAGYDGRLVSSRLKFNNIVNFRGFPHIPGEDWLMAYPASGRVMDGGSLNGEA